MVTRRTCHCLSHGLFTSTDISNLDSSTCTWRMTIPLNRPGGLLRMCWRVEWKPPKTETTWKKANKGTGKSRTKKKYIAPQIFARSNVENIWATLIFYLKWERERKLQVIHHLFATHFFFFTILDGSETLDTRYIALIQRKKEGIVLKYADGGWVAWTRPRNRLLEHRILLY